MPKLEDLELKIKQTGSISTAGFKNLSEALERLSAAVKSFPKQADNVAAVNSAIKSINADKATALAKVATGLAKLADSASKVDVKSAGSIAAIGAAIEQMVDGIDTTKLSTISDALSKFKTSVNALKNGGGINRASVKGSSVKSLGDTNEVLGQEKTAATMEKTTESIGEATDAVQRFRESIKLSTPRVTSLGKAIARGLFVHPWRKLSESVKGVTGTFDNLWRSFKRIAMYRMLRSALKSITQGFATGIKHLYAWSDLVGNNFKQSMDSLATSANYLRNSLGAMVSPLIDALAPAVEVLVDKFVELLNVINQFFATMTGADTWRRAVRQQKEYAENTDKAAGAQKKLNHQLMAFDELNNISANNGGGRGSGGKTPEVDDKSFVVEQTSDWAKDIKEALEKDDWYGVGTLIGTKINDWVLKFDAGKWGRKLANKVNQAFSAFKGLIDTLKWKRIGIKAATFTNALFKNISAKKIKNTIVGLINGGLDLVKAYFQTAEWDQYALSAAEIINGLFSDVTAEKVGTTLGTIINSGFSFISTMVSGGMKKYIDPTTGEVFEEWRDGIDFTSIGKSIGTAISTALETVNFKTIGKTLADIGSGLLRLLEGAISKIDVSGIFNAIGDLISGFFSDPSKVVDSIKLIGLITGFKLLFGTVIPLALSGAETAIVEGFTKVFGGTAVSGAISGTVSEAVKSGVEAGAAGASVSALSVTLSNLGGAFISFLSTWGLPILATVGLTAGVLAAARAWDEQNNQDYEEMTKTKDYQVTETGFLQDYRSALKKILAGDESYMYEAQSLRELIYNSTKGKTNLMQIDSIEDVPAALEEVSKLLGTPSYWSADATELDETLQKLTKTNWEIKVTDKGQMLQKSTARAGKLVGSNGLGGIKAQYDTELKSPSLYEAEGATTTINSGLKKLNGTKYTTTFKSDSLKTGAKQADTLKGGMKAVGGKTIRMAFKSDSLKAGAKNASTVKDSTKAFSGKTATFTFNSPSLKTGASDASTLENSVNDLDGNTYSFKMTEDGLSDAASNSKLVYENLNGLAKSYAVALSVTGLNSAAEKAQALRDALAASGKTWKINITSDLRLKSANGTYFTVEPMAEGGFPQQGSLFLAGEQINQTELVGNINGRTGVASGAEITGIADAVYNTGDAEAALLREQNQLLRQLLAKKTDITLTPNVAAGRWVAQAQTAYARATGG